MTRSEIYSAVKTSPLHKDRYVLLEDFTYNGITVPAGYETNGADVPRLFWIFLPPNRSDYLPAVILHDYLTDKEMYKLADDIFEECLESLEIGPVTRFIMVSSVRSYHFIRYGVK